MYVMTISRGAVLNIEDEVEYSKWRMWRTENKFCVKNIIWEPFCEAKFNPLSSHQNYEVREGICLSSIFT